MIRYALTILLSAFLLFQVQPLIAKRILPWFGGGPAVWTTCMLFFQVLLLAGYAYAHLVARLPGKRQLLIHGGLLIAALCLLPIEPNPSWKPEGSETPVLRILLLLGASVGLPYLMLSTTGPLMQRWFGESHPGRSPYRLFALSNFGSLLALLSYPVAFEPLLPVHTQMLLWSGAFVGFVLLCMSCGWQIRGLAFTEPAASAGFAPDDLGDTRPTKGTVAFWIALAALPSVMLLATTNQLCQEVAVVPFLWVVPLSLYLLSFIICFDNERWYSRPVFGLMLFLAVGLACQFLPQGSSISLQKAVGVYSGILFACCMTCHGELARSKPHSRHLTLFYLAVSAGGALGGVFVVEIAPLIFTQFLEYHVGLIGCLVLTLLAWYRRPSIQLSHKMARAAQLGAVVLVTSVFAYLLGETLAQRSDILARTRNFYGILTVADREDAVLGSYILLRNGSINHGFQFQDPELKMTRASYYNEESGVGVAILNHPKYAGPETAPLKVGVIGLGTGTIAAYGREGDTFRFYEINPEVERIAREYFTYLSDSPATTEVVLGDARVMLERELAAGEPQQFDVLAVDAFSSDAIPMHLLTHECIQIYLQHLAEGGVLAIHISNTFLDLRPVTEALARAENLETGLVEYDDAEGVDGALSNTWVLLTRDPEFFERPGVSEMLYEWPEDLQPLLWTDDFGSLWPILFD